jgi:hypothetical protein
MAWTRCGLSFYFGMLLAFLGCCLFETIMKISLSTPYDSFLSPKNLIFPLNKNFKTHILKFSSSNSKTRFEIFIQGKKFRKRVMKFFNKGKKRRRLRV